jgi:Holliday junction resolvase
VSKAKQLGTAGENRIVEQAKAHGLHAHRQPGSGIYKDYPADVVIEDKVLVESMVRAVEKSQPGERYVRLDLNWLEKVVDEAAGAGFEMGVVVLQPKGARRRYTLIDFETFLDLLSRSNTR